MTAGELVESTLGLEVLGRASCKEIPSSEQAEENVSETNTLPWSITMVSGTMTGLAAAFSNRASTAMSRWCGRIESDIARIWLQPGRIGSGTSILASSTAHPRLSCPWA
ncbi:hypothetical protein [Streptomyces sp. bgisy100]|uniref:hypothetical protein n=1 Tax=Streptomyces sp. bgisy100 TaxID=3413783 RepID=UPI003D705C99